MNERGAEFFAWGQHRVVFELAKRLSDGERHLLGRRSLAFEAMSGAHLARNRHALRGVRRAVAHSPGQGSVARREGASRLRAGRAERGEGALCRRVRARGAQVDQALAPGEGAEGNVVGCRLSIKAPAGVLEGTGSGTSRSTAPDSYSSHLYFSIFEDMHNLLRSISNNQARIPVKEAV